MLKGGSVVLIASIVTIFEVKAHAVFNSGHFVQH